MSHKTKIGLMGLIVTSILSATSVTIHHGWNLISTAGVDNVDSNCLLNQINGTASLWTFENGQWKANSNNENTKHLISSANFPFVTTISKEQGFWVYNPNQDMQLDMNCSGQE